MIPTGKIVSVAVMDDGERRCAPGVIFYENDSYNINNGYVIERKLNSNGPNTPVHMRDGLGNDTISSFELFGPIKVLVDYHGSAKANAHTFSTSQSYLAANGGTYNNTISYAEIQKLNSDDILTTNEVLRLIGGSATSIIKYRDGHSIVGIKGADEGSASENIIRATISGGSVGKYTTPFYTTAQKTFTITPPVETIPYTKITNKGEQKEQNCPVISPWTGGQTLESCKKLCTDDPRCTTFNMIGGDCNRKACVSCNSPTDPNCNLKNYYSDDIEIWGNNR